MIHKNWQELIRPNRLDIRPGAEPTTKSPNHLSSSMRYLPTHKLTCTSHLVPKILLKL